MITSENIKLFNTTLKLQITLKLRSLYGDEACVMVTNPTQTICNLPSLSQTMKSSICVTAPQTVIDHGPERPLVDDAVSETLDVLALQAEAYEPAHERVRAWFATSHRRGWVGANDITHVLLIPVQLVL